MIPKRIKSPKIIARKTKSLSQSDEKGLCFQLRRNKGCRRARRGLCNTTPSSVLFQHMLSSQAISPNLAFLSSSGSPASRPLSFLPRPYSPSCWSCRTVTRRENSSPFVLQRGPLQPSFWSAPPSLQEL